MSKKATKGGDRVFLQNAVKTLAANIRFASVDNPVSTIVVTSSVPNEGKSTISIELARALAAGGKSVLLVECDLRRRSVANMIGTHSRHGIYAVLSSQVSLEEAMVETSQHGMCFLDCEPHIPNPVDILSSRRFQRFVEDLKRRFDYAIFDTPPLSAFVDASVIAAEADGTLLVVRQDFVKREELAAAYEQLKTANAHVLGAVLNYCETEKSEYYYSYYTKEGKKAPQIELDAAPAQQPTPKPIPKPQSAPAPAPKQTAPKQTSPQAQPAPSRQMTQQQAAAARAASRPAGASKPAASNPAVPGLKPLPNGSIINPGETSQFLVDAGYAARDYLDE